MAAYKYTDKKAKSDDGNCERRIFVRICGMSFHWLPRMATKPLVYANDGLGQKAGRSLNFGYVCVHMTYFIHVSFRLNGTPVQ